MDNVSFGQIKGLFASVVELPRLIDELPAGIILMDLDRRILFLNSASEVLSGYPPNGMSLVQNETGIRVQHRMFHEHIGKKKGMVRNDEMSRLSCGSYFVVKAPIFVFAFLSQAKGALGAYPVPQSAALKQFETGIFRNVSAFRLLDPGDKGKDLCTFLLLQVTFSQNSIPLVETEIV